MICQSCGGVVGRDCFNPEECMAITRDMADRYQTAESEQRSVEHQLHLLQQRNEHLEHQVKSQQQMMQAMRALPVDIPQQTLLVLIRLAYEMEILSGGRCAELLGECHQETLERGWTQSRIRDALVAADSELSAIAHGRPMSSKEELLKISHACRSIYECKDYQ